MVYLRNRVIGRNKMQNYWKQVPYRVLSKLQNKDVYLVYPESDPNAVKTENRVNLLDMSQVVQAARVQDKEELVEGVTQAVTRSHLSSTS